MVLKSVIVLLFLLTILALQCLVMADDDESLSLPTKDPIIPQTDAAGASTAAPTANTSNSTARAESYVIRTADKTTPQQLETIIEKYNLPKDGERFDWTGGLNYQSYYCWLTATAAETVSKDPLVQYVGRDRSDNPDASGFYHVDPRAEGDKESRDPNLWKRLPGNTAKHLHLFSRDRISDLSKNFGGLLFDKKLGEGSTIYIIDSGYNKDHSEFKNRPGPHWSITVPNAITGGTANEDEIDWAYPQVKPDGYKGHGTAAASVAGGDKLGFAPAAELVVVKVNNGAFKLGQRPTIQIPQVLPEKALEFAFSAILKDVRDHGKQRKAVVSISMFQAWVSDLNGKQGPVKATTQAIFEKFIADCADEGIIFVIPAGNNGNGAFIAQQGPSKKTLEWVRPTQPSPRVYVASLDFSLPARLGTDTNNVITVGGSRYDGYLWYQSTPRIRQNGDAGSITVYAQAGEVPTASNLDKTSTITRDGTSYAGPAVAGLIAYLLSVDTIYSQFSTNNAQFVMDVKNFIKDNAWSRCRFAQCVPPNAPVLNYKGSAVPKIVPVPINMAWKGYNPILPGEPGDPPPKRSVFTQSDLFLKRSTDDDSSILSEDTQIVHNFLPVFDPNNYTDTQIDGYYLCATNVTDCIGPERASLGSSMTAASSIFGNGSEPSSFSTSVTPDQSTVSEDPTTSTSSTSSDTSTTSSSSSSTTSSSSSSTSSTSSWVDPALTTTAGDNCGPNGIDAEEGTIDSCMYQTQTAA